MSTHKPEPEEDGYAFAERMLSERMIMLIALVIIALFAVISEWEAVLDLFFGLL